MDQNNTHVFQKMQNTRIIPKVVTFATSAQPIWPFNHATRRSKSFSSGRLYEFGLLILVFMVILILKIIIDIDKTVLYYNILYLYYNNFWSIVLYLPCPYSLVLNP